MAGTRPWVSWYPADILNDPKYLCLGRSARLTYRELLDRAWLAGCALPKDTRKLAALAGLTELEFQKDWQEMQDPQDPCFIEHPDDSKRLTNRRLLEEWRKADQQAKIARENGQKGGRPKKKEKPKKTQAVSKKNPEESYPHPQSHSQSQDKSKTSPPPAPKGASQEDLKLTPDEEPPKVFIELPLQGDKKHQVTEADLVELKELYPAVDVEQQLRNAKGWLKGHASRRPASNGMAFITNWLKKEQNEAARRQARASPGPVRPGADKRRSLG